MPTRHGKAACICVSHRRAVDVRACRLVGGTAANEYAHQIIIRRARNDRVLHQTCDSANGRGDASLDAMRPQRPDGATKGLQLLGKAIQQEGWPLREQDVMKLAVKDMHAIAHEHMSGPLKVSSRAAKCEVGRAFHAMLGEHEHVKKLALDAARGCGKGGVEDGEDASAHRKRTGADGGEGSERGGQAPSKRPRAQDPFAFPGMESEDSGPATSGAVDLEFLPDTVPSPGSSAVEDDDIGEGERVTADVSELPTQTAPHTSDESCHACDRGGVCSPRMVLHALDSRPG